ncbi:hypothetical protein [Bradyrhizobium sp. 18]|uniref:hypothetical protein n=1 Tax=Bradyrhizobium sp. 18 TaxID=2782657 RepID=UPI001FF8268B|nr:hypothetical protein [Bradyrhizobium sp. 18]MCK1506825.1 hypothetical protein [Bradyrhizobium sp. 18]
MSDEKENSTDATTVANMADAAEYLSRVTAEAGFVAISQDLRAVRDKLQSIAKSCRAVPDGG